MSHFQRIQDPITLMFITPCVMVLFILQSLILNQAWYITYFINQFSEIQHELSNMTHKVTKLSSIIIPFFQSSFSQDIRINVIIYKYIEKYKENHLNSSISNLHVNSLLVNNVSQIVNTILKEKNKAGRLTLSDFKTQYMEKETATHFSILAWKTTWIEEPAGYSPWDHKESDKTK